MTNEKFKVEATKQTVNNTGDITRIYDIKATFRQSDIQAGAIESGEVLDIQTKVCLASFNAWDSNHLNINFNVCSDRAKLMDAVETFIAETKSFIG